MGTTEEEKKVSIAAVSHSFTSVLYELPSYT